MIFKAKHVRLILEGKKTQTRRINRGNYKVGKSYAIQPCRTCKGIEAFRIVIDRIWKEKVALEPEMRKSPKFNIISEQDATAEGGYTPAEFELLFRKLYPGWIGTHRWAFEFHVYDGIDEETAKTYAQSMENSLDKIFRIQE